MKRRAARTGLLLIVGSLAGCGGSDDRSSGLFGPDAGEMVAMAFDPDDSDNRRRGILLLSDEKWGLEEPYLEGYATLLRTDTDPRVRSAAVRALGKAGDEKYLPNVIDALEDSDAQVRRDAAVALDEMPGRKAIAPVMRYARNDSSADVRAACARALRRYPRPEVIRTLIDCLDDAAFCVRYRAREALRELSGRDLGYDASQWAAIGPEKLLERPAEPSRPWWDLMGVTGGKEPASQPATGGDEEPPAVEPTATRPAEQGASHAAERPWWDMLDVTAHPDADDEGT